MLPPLGSGHDGRLRVCASGVLLAAVLGAGMMLAGTAAGAEPDEPAPPPAQTGPPPPETAPPSAPTNPPATIAPVILADPTITLTVPAAPAAKPKQAVAKPPSAAAPAPVAKEETATPPSAVRPPERYRPPQTRSYAEPAVPKATAKPKRNAKPKPARRPKQLPAAVATSVAPQYTVVVRDSTRASGLGAQLPPQAVVESPPDRGVYLLIALAIVGSLLLGIAGAAPRLAWYWPKIFVPVTRERDGLSFFGACLIVCGIVAWAIVAPVA